MPCLAFARGGHQRAVHVDLRFGEERFGLPGPDLAAALRGRPLASVADVMLARSGGRNRRPWSDRESAVRPGRRDTLRRCAAVPRSSRQCRRTARCRPDSARGRSRDRAGGHLQQVQRPVDRFCQAQLTHQQLDRADSAVSSCRCVRSANS